MNFLNLLLTSLAKLTKTLIFLKFCFLHDNKTIFTGKPRITSEEIDTSTNLENINVVKEGYSYDLNCEVEFSNELNSTIQWFRNNIVVSSNENFTTEVVNLENDGDTYECKYNDELDSDSKQFKLDVQCWFLYKLYCF